MAAAEELLMKPDSLPAERLCFLVTVLADGHISKIRITRGYIRAVRPVGFLEALERLAQQLSCFFEFALVAVDAGKIGLPESQSSYILGLGAQLYGSLEVFLSLIVLALHSVCSAKRIVDALGLQRCLKPR